GAGMGAGGNLVAQAATGGPIDWGSVALSAGIGGVSAGVGARLMAARGVNAGRAAGPPSGTTGVSAPSNALRPPTPAVPPSTPGSLSSPDFVVHPNGTVIPVPEGAVGPTFTANNAGFQYTGGSGGHGLDPRTTSVRIMDPVTGGKYAYPNGYVSYSNASGQAVNPYTGQTVPKSSSWWHMPL
ncbi:MAG TPA: hypothetical protein VKL22_01330, partial [Actinomycetota bacterium]|nr:hypothetical protein [Actinomycetota bacterium]